MRLSSQRMLGAVVAAVIGGLVAVSLLCPFDMVLPCVV